MYFFQIGKAGLAGVLLSFFIYSPTVWASPCFEEKKVRDGFVLNKEIKKKIDGSIGLFSWVHVMCSPQT